MENKIKVVELFAGVGGFRLGLEDFGRSPRVGLSVPIFCFFKEKNKRISSSIPNAKPHLI